MDHKRISERLRQHIVYISDRKNFNTREEQLLYEQGILLGLISSLSLYDSKNFDLIIKQLKNLEPRN